MNFLKEYNRIYKKLHKHRLRASCCERCANVLAYKYLDGKDGYAECSDK